MVDRQTLPSRRHGEAIAFECEGHRYRACISRFSDGRLAEIFLDASKPGTAVAVAAHDLAVAASLALQHGAPVDTLRKATMRHPNGAGAGPLGALLDLIEEGRL